MLYDKNASPWNQVEILGVGMNIPDRDGNDRIITYFIGRDGKKKVILNLSYTVYYVSQDILDEGKVVAEAGMQIEVMVWGSEICAMRNVPISPPKVLPSPDVASL